MDRIAFVLLEEVAPRIATPAHGCLGGDLCSAGR